MEKTWILDEAPPGEIKLLADKLGVAPAVAHLLWHRDLATLEAARQFFNPDLSDLHDPFLMKDMDVAVVAIQDQLRHARPIMILGDYDVDGTTGASILYLFLKSLGLPCSVYIPDRETEGYGVSNQAADTAVAKGVDLVITCDCGITAVETIQYARDKGVRFIVSDHHIPGETLPPAIAVLNPKRSDCDYPNKNLCGAGVAFKLVQGLGQEEDIDFHRCSQLLDLAAIGTSADLVPIIGENRVMVAKGLELIAAGSRPGVDALKEVAGVRKETIQVTDVVFGLAPRINAVGRLGEATRAVRLLTAEDQVTASQLSRVLDTENENRKSIETQIVDEAIRMANAKVDPREKKGLVLYREGWHHGVIGIVASKLKERFWVPVIMIAVNDGIGKASARSLEGFDMYDALRRCSDLLESFGGHTMAAGLTIREENLPALEERFLEITAREVLPEMMKPRLQIEEELEFTQINLQLMETLRRLAPYGPGNMRPLFVSKGLRPTGHPRIVGTNHLKFKISQGRRVLDAIGFGLGEYYERLIGNRPIDCVYALTENEWQGRKSIQLEVKDLRFSEE